MSGWESLQRIKHLEEQVDKLGFKFSKPKHVYPSGVDGAVSLMPKDNDSVPMYSRDAEVYVGSLELLETWLQGVEWARNYDRMCKISSDKTRATAEQKECNRQLMQTLKLGIRVEGVEK